MRKIMKYLFTFVTVVVAFFVWLQPIQAQVTGAISGLVVDVETGDALPGANITVQGTNFGSSTDMQGNYEIRNVPAGSYTLLASYIGYKEMSQNVVVVAGEKAAINFSMETDILTGEELVVIGYATQQLRDVTGSIATVRSEELNTVATTSINQMLKGKAAGLIMTQRTAQPGGGVEVNVRGAISPLGNNSPLYVIDGVPITNYDSPIPDLNDAQLGYYGGIDQDPLSY